MIWDIVKRIAMGLFILCIAALITFFILLVFVHPWSAVPLIIVGIAYFIGWQVLD